MRALLHTFVKLPVYIPEPCNDWVLCQNVQPPKEYTLPSGLILPQDETREDLAVVISVGQGYFVGGTGAWTALKVVPGDVVRTTRKKGRTAYLDAMGDHGIGDTQTSYNYYQANEIIAIEYHSEKIADEIKRIRAEFPITITAKEEEDFNREQERKKEEEHRKNTERAKARKKFKRS